MYSFSFLVAGCNVSCVKQFLSFSMITEHIFLLATIRSCKAHVLSESCLQMYYELNFLIYSNSFLGAVHNMSYIKRFYSPAMITECHFLYLLQFETVRIIFLKIKNMPVSVLQLQILNCIKHFFRYRV